MRGHLIPFWHEPRPQSGRLLTRASRVLKQLRESQEAQALALQIHAADVRLERVPNVAFSDLTPQQRQELIDRAAVAIRLGDPVASAAAIAHGGIAVRREHPHQVPDLAVGASIAKSAITAALRHLKGYIGERG